MLRRTAFKLLGASALMTFGAVTREARAATLIKLGTTAPKSSPWGQLLSIWEAAVKEKSGGRLEVQIFYSGQQGDEGAMVGKMKAGQLDGAFVSAVGLSKIYKPILALHMPGLFASWPKLDAARDAMKADFEKGVQDAAFTMLGWGDIGRTHLMSKGFEVRTPDDLKGKKPYLWRDDAIDPVFFDVVSGVTPVPLNTPEVLPQLNVGAIDVVTAGALSAEQMQWTSKLDTITEDPSSFAIGGLVVASRVLAPLPADLRDIFAETARVTMVAMTKRIRGEDDAAFARLKAKLKVVTRTADEKAKWTALCKAVRQRLGQGTFAPELVAKLEGLAK